MEENREIVESTNEVQNNTQGKRYTTKVVLGIRVLVGAYILYLVYQILSSGDPKPIPVWIFVVIFIISGLLMVILSGKKLLLGEYEGGKADISSDDNDAGMILEENSSSKESSGDIIEEITDAEIIEAGDERALEFTKDTRIETVKESDIEELD